MNTSTAIAVALAVAVITAAMYFIYAPALFNTKTNNISKNTMKTEQTTGDTGIVSNETKGLLITDEKQGTGDVAKDGDTVAVKYVGTLANGTVFDSTQKHGDKPFTFTLGAGQVISGWDKGVVGMKVGGVRKLVISPELGYGDRAVGPIPSNSTLTFEVTLVSVTSPAK